MRRAAGALRWGRPAPRRLRQHRQLSRRSCMPPRCRRSGSAAGSTACRRRHADADPHVRCAGRRRHRAPPPWPPRGARSWRSPPMLVLPMSVALAASAAQDALLIPLAALAVALVDRARAEPGQRAGPALSAIVAACAAAGDPGAAAAAAAGRAAAAAARRRACDRGSALALAVVAATVRGRSYISLRVSVPMNVAYPGAQRAASCCAIRWRSAGCWHDTDATMRASTSPAP